MNEANHCVDCCCAQSWRALNITEYTGKSIPEHIELLRAELDQLRTRHEAACNEIEHQREYIRQRNFPEPYRIGNVIAVGKELRYVMQIIRILHDYPDMAIEVAAYWESGLNTAHAHITHLEAEVKRLLAMTDQRVGT